MVLHDLYRIMNISQKIIVKDWNNGVNTVYKGYIEGIPLKYMDKSVLSIQTLYNPNNTIIIIIK